MNNKEEIQLLNSDIKELKRQKDKLYNAKRYKENKEQLILNSSKYYHTQKKKDINYSSKLNERVKARNKKILIEQGKTPQPKRGRPRLKPVDEDIEIKKNVGRPQKYFF